MKLDFNYDGKTRLKAWWKQVRANFQTLQDSFNAEESERKTADSTLQQNINTKAPINHKSTGTGYGVGDGLNYGHVRLFDSPNNAFSETSGYAATPKAVRTALAKAEEGIDAAAEVQDNLNTEISNRQTADNTLQTNINAKAPINHRSTAATYGVGDGSYYGHVKLSDSVGSTSGASGGIAATPAAVKTVKEGLDSEVSARQAADKALQENIDKIRYDYFGDGSSLTFKWTGGTPEPYFLNGEAAVDINLSGMFKLDGVACGIMDTHTLLLYNQHDKRLCTIV